MSEAEQRLKAIINTMVDAIIIFDEKGILETFNLAAERMFGYSHLEVVGLNINILIAEPHRGKHDEYLKIYQESAENSAIGIRRELVGQRKDGTFFPLDLALSEAHLENQTIFTGIIRNLTESKQADEALRRITKYLDVILLNLPVGVAILEGPEFRYFRINQALADLNGLSVDDHLGRPLAEVLPHAKEMIIPELDKVIDTGCPILHREFSIKLPNNPDSAVNLVDWQIPVPNKDNKLSAVVSIVVDTTQLTVAQAMLVQSAKLAAIGQIASGLAHEINQPLGEIKVRADFTKLILEQEQDINREKVSDNLNAISAGIDRATKIIKHLKIFSRQDRLSEYEKVDINWLVNESFVLMHEAMQLERIDVQKELAESLPQVSCDYIRIEQVITNLISNAKDALQMSDVKQLVVRSYRRGNNIFIEVKDSGKGIPRAIIGKIFDPFFTTKPVGQGTGLGLSISYGIIQEHNGTLAVNSKEGEGTCFTISLPIAT